MGIDEMAPPPESVKSTYGCWWWLYLIVLIGCAVGEGLAQDVFGVLLFILISLIVWYMVKDSYIRMSQYCVFMFCFLCSIQFVFDAVLLAVSVGGRRTQRVERKPISESKMSYTTIIETRPFFDDSAGFVYNCQSWMMIISMVTMLLGAILAYKTYNAWPTGLLQDEEDPIYGGGAAPMPAQQRPQVQRNDYGAAGGAAEARRQQAPPGGPEGNEGRQQAQRPGQGPGGFRVFEGQGQRLGDRDD
jgi:hypothetical protein